MKVSLAAAWLPALNGSSGKALRFVTVRPLRAIRLTHHWDYRDTYTIMAYLFFV